jgi:hypothetical protein
MGAPLIGIPFVDHGRTMEGADCLAWARLVYALRAPQIEWPDEHAYDGTDSEDAATIARLMDMARESGDWIKIEKGEERELDIVEIRVHGYPDHIGVVLAAWRRGAHMMAAPTGSSLLFYRGPEYKHIIIGFRRHRLLAAAQAA